MDSNTVLLWLTGGICGALIGRGVYARSRGLRSWIFVASLVGASALVSYWQRPEIAGYVGAGLCALFVLAPMYANSFAFRLAGRRRFGAARLLARIAIALHPTRQMRRGLGYLDALEHSTRGLSSAGELDPSTSLGRFGYVHALRSEGRWHELLAFTGRMPPAILYTEPAVAFHHLRALAELSEIETLLTTYLELERRPALASARELMRLVVAARLGRVDLVDQLLAGPAGAGMTDGTPAYWRAIALEVAGAPEAEPLLQKLAEHADPDVRRAARARLTAPFAPLSPAELSPLAQQIAAELAREVESAAGLNLRTQRAPITWLLIAICVAVFAIEELAGGSTDIGTLIDLGALVIPPLPGSDGALRLLCAAFLHLGATHLVMNVLGLWALGRQVEGAIGALRTLGVFLVSAIVGNAVALALLKGPTVLVGASGGVLGLLGALLAIAVRRHYLRRTRFLRRQLQEIGFVLLLQAIFDFVTPQISSTVHVAGFVSGMLATFAFAWQRAR